MKYSFWAICSNPECKFSMSCPDGLDIGSGCRLCGSELIRECKECGFPVDYKGALFCGKCLKRLKPEPAPKESV